MSECEEFEERTDKEVIQNLYEAGIVVLVINDNKLSNLDIEDIEYFDDTKADGGSVSDAVEKIYKISTISD